MTVPSSIVYSDEIGLIAETRKNDDEGDEEVEERLESSGKSSGETRAKKNTEMIESVIEFK